MRLPNPFAIGRFLVRALFMPDRPLLAQLVVIRRCNLDCGYCNEFDLVSKPVPLEALRDRVTRLAQLGTAAVTLTGGEPLLHPDLPEVIRFVRRNRMACTLITNASLITPERIEQFNQAGLQQLQVSIDNLVPDAVSRKSLRGIDPKLRLLAQHAKFNVNVNSVLGISDERTPDAVEVARRAIELGFSHSVAVLHGHDGIMKPLSELQQRTYAQIGRMSRSWVHRFNYHAFQKNLMQGRPNPWKCRAGGRYLYICEDGLVHWCSQQRGYPGIPLARYSRDDIRRESNTQKGCAAFCSLSCVHQVSFVDGWRGRQTIADPTSKRHAEAA
jgi:MoaA/NifB/PqqE/SkfB family radical SAM enzyme